MPDAIDGLPMAFMPQLEFACEAKARSSLRAGASYAKKDSFRSVIRGLRVCMVSVRLVECLAEASEAEVAHIHYHYTAYPA